MQQYPAQFQRLLIIVFLALVQLFAPLVHAHTGDSRQSGVHLHIPGADQDDNGPVLTADPGLEIGIESMRRESISLAPELDSQALIVSLPQEGVYADSSIPPLAPVITPTQSRRCDPNPPRGPPATARC